MREKVKFPALDKTYNLKSRQDLLDQDYIEKLNDEEKDFLNRFNEEFNNANFTHAGKKLHKTQTLRKERYDANNARNRCRYTRAKSIGALHELDFASGSLDLDPAEKQAEEKRIDVLMEISKIVKTNKDLKKKSQNWYKKGYSPERILRKLKQMKQLSDFDNALQSSKKSKNSTKNKK